MSQELQNKRFPYEIELLIRSFLLPNLTTCIHNKSTVQQAIKSKFTEYLPLTGERFVQTNQGVFIPNYICQLKHLVRDKLHKRTRQRIIADVTDNLHQYVF